ncbi:MAG: MFS transporter [Ruminococcaceae bacterium]|nr:MFS transporter [Oscillospiraceae bacterium]
MNRIEIAEENMLSGDIKKNKIKAIIAYTARTVALMCASGTLMQTFLSSLGFESSLIYLHSTLLQAANVLTIILASGWANNGSPIKKSAFTTIPIGLLFLCYVPIAIANHATPLTYVLLAAFGILQQIAYGFFTVCEYKTPYYIYKADEYGMMLSVCGIISSVFSLLLGYFITFLTSKFEFTVIMKFAFIISAVLMLIAFIAIYFEKSLRKETPEETVSENKKNMKVRLLKTPVFTRLIHANLMRGFATGVISVLAAVALDLGHTETLTASMVFAQSLASLAACAFFAMVSKKISERAIVIAGSLFVVLIPLLLIKDSMTFLIIYTVIIVGRTLIDYSVPSMLLKAVPVEIAGPYHAWRMALQNAGMLIATSLATVIPVPYLLAAAAVFQLISGVSFAKVVWTYTQNKM